MPKNNIRPDQISEFVTALKGRREIPLKFEYLGEGAHDWDRIINDKDYSLGDIEEKLIRDNSKKIFKACKDANILDVGCGNGLKAKTLIEQFEKQVDAVNYCALDISEEMLDLALGNIAKASFHNKINASKQIVDFEGGNFANITRAIKKTGQPNNLLLLLGHTLGNPSDKNRVLMNLRESMTASDRLLIGIEYIDKNNKELVLEHYQCEPVYSMAFTSLKMLGIKRNNGEFDIEYNPEANQVEGYFRFLKDADVEFEGESIYFTQDERIKLFISSRFTLGSIKKLLSETGFKIIDLYKNAKKHYVLILCEPERHK